jgi:COP9 signalosome complex subunit 8
MVNGPPTPPPTSATELQDEARTRAPVASPAASAAPVASATTTTTQPRQPTDAYQYILPKLVNLAAQNDFGALVRLAEQTDLNVGKSLSEKLLYLTPAG